MVKAAAAQRYAEKTQTLASDVGTRIRNARLERGLSLAQVGGDDLSRSFLSLVELGRSRISLRALAIVSDRLNLPMSYFLESAEASPELVGELQLDEAEAALRLGNPKIALKLVNEFDVPETLQARALWLRGCSQLELGRIREAVNTLHEALPQARQGEDIRLQLQVELALAGALKDAGNYEEALVHLKRVRTAAARGPELAPFRGEILAQLGQVEALLGEREAAAQTFEEARSLIEASMQEDVVASSLKAVSEFYRERGDLQRAIRYSRVRLGALQATQARKSGARELATMASQTFEMGNVDAAGAFARRAVELAQQAGASQIEAIARGTLAEISVELGDDEEARRQATRAQELAGSDQDSSVGAWLALARVAERSNDPAHADDLYRRALDRLAKGDNGRAYAAAAYEYSLALKNRGDTEAALRFALEAANPHSAVPREVELKSS